MTGAELGRPTWAPGCRSVAVGALFPYSDRYREGLNQVLLYSFEGASWSQSLLFPAHSAARAGRCAAASRLYVEPAGRSIEPPVANLARYSRKSTMLMRPPPAGCSRRCEELLAAVDEGAGVSDSAPPRLSRGWPYFFFHGGKPCLSLRLSA